MVVKPGYKQTELGAIPEDWDEYSLGDLISFEGGSQPDKSVFRASWKTGYIRLIQIRDYKTDKFETYVPTHLARRFCNEDDIMIGRYGPPIFQILRGLFGAYNVALIKAIPTPQINKNYAYYFLKQDTLFSFIEKLSQRSSGQTGVDLTGLRAYPFPLPPTITEQSAIAGALSDADALIESMEQLITKKRQVKQGAMQELLTGKKRLPGFEVKHGYKQTELGMIPEDWGVKPLYALSDKIMVGIASAATHAYRDKGVVMFRNQNIKPGYLDDSDILYIAEDYEETFKNKRLKSGDLLTARTGYPGTTSMVPAQYEGAQSFTTLITRPLRNLVDSAYLCCFINSEAGQNYFTQNQIGGGQKNVNAGSLKNLSVPLPTTKAEQGAIAAVLSDMDAEITVLEEKLTKARQLKQGMMQELLTGRIRLV